jgi:plasmid stabilization system protein ParE
MKVYWTENAIRHLFNIYEYIAANSTTYALRMVDRITRRSEQIADHPFVRQNGAGIRSGIYPRDHRKTLPHYLQDKT